ncbi:MAG: thiamine-phosphate kinase [Woeseiaceae bacterium]
MDEFELIRRFFSKDNNDTSVLIGVGDDGAIISPSPGHDLVMSADTLIENVHFPDCLPAEDIGYRCVAVNVSDIAAMGARARWMTLALTLPDVDEKWLQQFSDGLYHAAQEYDVSLIGGDTTSAQQISLTISITGEVLPDQAITRSQARRDDLIFVTGNLGDAAAGLDLLVNSAASSKTEEFLIQRFSRPSARSEIGQALCGIATAAIDVSDGLYADTKKLLMASELGGHLYIDRLPISMELKKIFNQEQRLKFALSGGDDYELLFTAPAMKLNEIRKIAHIYNIPITEIGEVRNQSELNCSLNDKLINYDDSGYLHFNG